MDKKPAGTRATIIRSTMLACILTGPSLGVFFAAYHILNDVLTAGIAGGIVHFIALGFSFRIYKKLAALKI